MAVDRTGGNLTGKPARLLSGSRDQGLRLLLVEQRGALADHRSLSSSRPRVERRFYQLVIIELGSENRF